MHLVSYWELQNYIRTISCIESKFLLGLKIFSLKPENILIDKSGYAVITDFGLSKDQVTDRTDSFCGTAEYMAPEVILKKPYDKSVDWWSFGCILYEMMHGIPPFYTSKREKTFGLILRKFLSLSNSHRY
jgi:serine/threonine protein kinase